MELTPMALAKSLNRSFVFASLKGLLGAAVLVWFLGNPLHWFNGRYDALSAQVWNAYDPPALNPENKQRCDELLSQYHFVRKLRDEIEAWPILLIAGSIGPLVLLRQTAKDVSTGRNAFFSTR